MQTALVTPANHYIDKVNPFPMIVVHPNFKTQKHLPSTYRIETYGKDLFYSLSYEFSPEGKVSKRTATRANSAETAVYSYY